MKRLLIIAVATIYCLSAAACSSLGSSSSSSTSSTSSTGSKPSSIAESNVGNNPSVGLGFVSTTEESNAASDKGSGAVKFNLVACALGIDDDGKILDVKFDSLQADVGFDITGMFTGDVKAEPKSKKELGYDYNMKSVSGIKKEWFEQIAALEDWMRGKTVNDVLSMKVTGNDTAYKGVPTEDDLKTSVTISVTDQLRALEKAYSDAKK